MIDQSINSIFKASRHALSKQAVQKKRPEAQKQILGPAQEFDQRTQRSKILSQLHK